MDEREKEVMILAAEQARYEVLIRGLLNNSGLDYGGKALTFSDTFINCFIKAVYPMDYKDRIEQLRRERGYEDE